MMWLRRARGLGQYGRRRIRHWRNARADRAPKVLMLVYHRVLPDASFNPFDTIVSLKTFTRQLDALARRFPVVSLRDAIQQTRRGAAGADTQIVLTFDDGYWDNYEIVFPLLQRQGLPAAFFLPTDFVDEERPIWDWELVSLLRAAPSARSLAVAEASLARRWFEPSTLFALRVIDALKGATLQSIHELLERLREHVPARAQVPDLVRGCFGWQAARAMQQAGMEIGAHSRSHRSLARLPFEEAVREIRDSKAVIERQLGTACTHFAFPFGSRRDYTEALIQEVAAAGFESCLLNIHGYNHLDNGHAGWRRIIMTEMTDLHALLG